MPLINVVVILIVVGLLLWVIEQCPLDGGIKKVIRVVVLACVILWILSLFVGGLSVPIYVGRPHR